MVYAFVLAAFIKLLLITESPWLCAGLYTGLAAIGAVIAVLEGGTSVFRALLTVALAGGVAYAYFWSLSRIERGTGTWWAVLLAGPLITAIIVRKATTELWRVFLVHVRDRGKMGPVAQPARWMWMPTCAWCVRPDLSVQGNPEVDFLG